MPALLKDKTAHILTLNDNGPSEFNVVISYANAKTEDSVQTFSAQLTEELKRALPGFQLKSQRECTVDKTPAMEIFYSWTNQGNCLEQRQVITLVHGPLPDQMQAVLIAATCLNSFSDKWNQAFDAMLASLKLRRPIGGDDDAQNSVAQGDDPSVSAASYCFAMSLRDNVLHVLDSIEQAYELANPIDVEDGLWKFYRNDGESLEVLWQQPNRHHLMRREAGRYQLRPNAGVTQLAPLSSRLMMVERVKGLGQIHDIASLQQHLTASGAKPDQL